MTKTHKHHRWSIRSSFLVTCLTALYVALIPICTALLPAASHANERPNVILIMADDMGFECVGPQSEFRTPNLDEMAKAGVSFNHCYSQPLCTPSRVKIMTGTSNVRTYTKFGHMNSALKTFGNYAKEAGYATCFAGKWQLSGGDDYKAIVRGFGFDRYCIGHRTFEGEKSASRYKNASIDRDGSRTYHPGEYAPDIINQYVTDFIEDNAEKPFFIYYPMVLTHGPFHQTPLSTDWDKLAFRDEKHFKDMVFYCDRLVGNVRDTLEKKGLLENTLILFTGDNGTGNEISTTFADEEIRGGKGMMTDAGTHVPLIAYWAGKTMPSVSNDLVDFSDFLPTVCDAFRVPLSTKTPIDGESFLPEVLGESSKRRGYAYVWYSRKGNADDAEAFVRDARFKLYQSTGAFFDIKNDALEAAPLDTKNLEGSAIDAYAMLSAVLDEKRKLHEQRFKSETKAPAKQARKTRKQKT